MPALTMKQVTDAVSAALKPVQDAVASLRTDVDALKPLQAQVTTMRADVVTLQSDQGITAMLVDALNDAVTKLEDKVFPPEPEPEPTPEPTDWATRSAGRIFARRLASADATDANLAARHPNADVCVWQPGGYVEPVIDPVKQALMFPVVQGKGNADWVFRIPPAGANTFRALQWQLQFNHDFIGTTFRTSGGGYPGIKLAIISLFERSSPSNKLVVSTMDQHKFPFLYRYNWQSGATENLEPAVGNPPTDFDWQPKQGQPATCLYSRTNATPQGQAVPGCDTLVADKWITFDLEAETGDVVAGTNGQAWHCTMRLWMTIEGVRKLVIDYGPQCQGYQGRRAEPWTGIWLVPYMTDRDPAQAFQGWPTVWAREVIFDDKPIAGALPQPEPTPDPVPVPDPAPTPDPVPVPSDLPSFVPAPGTFAEFTTNVPTDLASTSDPWIKAAILANWTGGTFIEDFGDAGAAAYHGGGEHFSWPDRGGVLLLDVAAQRYVMRCVSPQHMGVVSGTTGPSGSLTDRYGAYQDNGYPQSKHTYNSLAPFPRDWGGGEQGGLVRVCHAGGLTNPQVGAAPGYGLAATWAFDLAQTVNGARRLTGEQTYDLGSGNPAYTNDAPGTCVDTLREGWWVFARTGANTGDRMVFTHKDGTIEPPGTQAIGLNWGRLHHFADDDTLVAIATGINICHPGLTNPWKTITTVADAADQSDWTALQAYLGYPGFQWCSLLNCWVGIDSKNPLKADGTPDLTAARVWKIIPPDTAAKRWIDPWRVQRETVTSSDGSVIDMKTDHAVNAGNGTSYGKLVECKKMRSLVWTRRIDKPGQLIRLRGM